MNRTIARKEVHCFIGRVMGIDTARELFAPVMRSDDLLLMEHWMVHNRIAYTVAWLPDLGEHGVFEVTMGWENEEDFVSVVHSDKAIAFTTAFCLLHGSPGFTVCYNDIWVTINEREDDV